MKKNNEKNRAILFFLDGLNGRIHALDPCSGKMETVINNCGGTPDGITVDSVRKYIYWTNMGQHYNLNDGFIERADFDGSNRKTIIPTGCTFTPKQCKLDENHQHLYWCDREGMRVMRSNAHGSEITTLYEAGSTEEERADETRHCVGIAVDFPGNRFYWTQKGPPDGGKGRIFSGPLNTGRTLYAGDSSILLVADNLPEPIDLDIDDRTRDLYWSDRGNLPGGNSISRISIRDTFPAPLQQLVSGLQEAIGLTLDPGNSRMFFTDLSGKLYGGRMDGKEVSTLITMEGSFTGLVYTEI